MRCTRLWHPQAMQGILSVWFLGKVWQTNE